ncbi:MAG: AAA family ATPase [Chloroflexi bacterium]|nr:AAA family ATPase [Chloroflexota bacterium]
MLALTLLGVPEISLDGRILTFKRLGSITLLAYLVLSRRLHAREMLATLLAGDSPDDQARKLLSNLLVDIRQQVGDYLVATRQSVSFNRARPYTLDVTDFQARAANCRDGSPLEDLEAAIELYRGEFLEGLSHSVATDFESWQSAQREELRGLYMQLLRAHVDASLDQAAWDRGIQSARRLLTQEPWQEESHRQLIVMLARSGQRHAAIAQYLACRRTLREEMGVEPSPETAALFHRVRGASIAPTHNLPHPALPFVGRRRQVRQLSALLTDPDCQLVTLSGLSGSGKTSLALQVARGFAAPDSPPPEQPFPDGIFHVDLGQAASSDPSANLSLAAATNVLAAALEATLLGALPADTGDTWARVTAHLSDRAMLLVLDHFDRVQAAASVLPTLLARAPHLKLLVTSHVPLHLVGERVLHLDGLCLPESAEEIETADASALFLQEARRVALDFELSDAERAPLVRLCHRLGGFPLALVLAARWTPMLSCSAILGEVQSGMGLDALTTTDADLPQRHRSLACMLERVLADVQGESRALRWATAVASGTTLQSVPREFIPQLKRLAEHGLLSVNTALGTFELHPLLQAYADHADSTRPAPELVA